MTERKKQELIEFIDRRKMASQIIIDKFTLLLVDFNDDFLISKTIRKGDKIYKKEKRLYFIDKDTGAEGLLKFINELQREYTE